MLVELDDMKRVLVVSELRVKVVKVLETIEVLIKPVEVVEPTIGPPELLKLVLETEGEVLDPTALLDVADDVEGALVGELEVALVDSLVTDVDVEVMLEVGVVDIDP